MRILIASAAALLAATTGAVAQSNFDYCLKTQSGMTACSYQSMAQCEQAKQTTDECVTRSQAIGTTGAGGQTAPDGSPMRSPPMNPPPGPQQPK